MEKLLVGLVVVLSEIIKENFGFKIVNPYLELSNLMFTDYKSLSLQIVFTCTYPNVCNIKIEW